MCTARAKFATHAIHAVLAHGAAPRGTLPRCAPRPTGALGDNSRVEIHAVVKVMVTVTMMLCATLAAHADVKSHTT